MTWVSEKDANGEPVKMTKAQWRQMHDASLLAEAEARHRHQRRWEAIYTWRVERDG